MKGSPAEERFKTVAQVVAILMLAGILLLVFHKGYTDFRALSQAHPGDGFWLEYIRYLLRNLAG